jgi:acetolactate synthase small subunit
MTGVDDRWVVFVAALDRGGALSALTETFSSRGVSFESFNTLDVHDGVGRMSILFRGSERIAQVLARTLERLAVVRAVVLFRADDPEVRAVAVVRGGVPADPASIVHAWDGMEVVAGPLASVEAAVATARASGAVVQALTVVPPA